MNIATNIAIVQKGKVTNIIWGMIYQKEEFEETYDCIAVPIDDLAVQIGDTYDGECFKRGKQKILTTAEQHSAEIAELDQYIVDTLYTQITEGVK